MKKCPKCGAESFYVTAHVAQDWKVDGNGTFLEVVDDCSQVVHQPDDNDLWQCANCSYQAEGSAFEAE